MEHYLKIKSAECPNCGKTAPDEPYFNETEHPIIIDYRRFDSDWGSRITWNELHHCTSCDTKFWFESGN